MKLTSLIIRPEHDWKRVSAENPLKAVVKLESEGSTIECVLSEAAMLRMIDLCADEITAGAKANMDAFREAVLTIDGEKSRALLGATQ